MRGGLGLVACGIRGCRRLCAPVGTRALTSRGISARDSEERRRRDTGAARLSRSCRRAAATGQEIAKPCAARAACSRAGAERVAHIAQSVERDLGKIEVTGSIPVVGSCQSMEAAAMRG